MTIDTKNLRVLAEAATPGPWAYGTFHRLLVVPVVNGLPDKHDAIADLGAGAIPWKDAEREYQNAAFIAACSPDIVIGLVDALERKDGLLKRASEALNESYDIVNHNYVSDWRHGLPTRQAQLDGMLAQVKEHSDVIEAITKEIVI